jgi:hypothetical protein
MENFHTFIGVASRLIIANQPVDAMRLEESLRLQWRAGGTAPRIKQRVVVPAGSGLARLGRVPAPTQ